MQRESGHLIRAILRTVQTCNTGAAPSYQRCLTSCSNLYTRGLSSSCTTNACGTILLTRQQSTPLIQTSWHELQCRGFAAQTAARSHSRAHQAEQHRSQLAAPSGTQGLYLMAFTVAMIGVTYASVPLYRMFCQATGYGGTVQQGSTGTPRAALPSTMYRFHALFVLLDAIANCNTRSKSGSRHHCGVAAASST